MSDVQNIFSSYVTLSMLGCSDRTDCGGVCLAVHTSYNDRDVSMADCVKE